MTLLFLILFFIGLIGMSVIIIRKIPVLADLSHNEVKGTKPFFLKRLIRGGWSVFKGIFRRREGGKNDLMFETENEPKDKFSEDYWKKVRRKG